MSGPILAATDFSARADRAVDRAIRLGKELGREVELVHAIEYAPGQTTDAEELDRRMRDVLPETDFKVRFSYPEGSVPAAIAGRAEEVDASMMVLGVARYNSVGDYFLGTAVDRIIRGTSKPVIVVKNRPHSPYRKILVATDFSDPSHLAMDWVATTFPDAEIHLLHVFAVPFQAWNKAPYVAEEIEAEARTKIGEFMDDLPEDVQERCRSHVERGSLCSVTNRLVDDLGVDLVVVGSQGETGFRHATIGSQASSVLETSKADTALVGRRVA